MLTLTFQTNDTPDGLRAVMNAVSALLKRHTAKPATSTSNHEPVTPGHAVVASWYSRLGPGSRSFWIRSAKLALTKPEWTFDDLAAFTSDKKEVLRSNHRNSYRAIKAEGATDPLTKTWDAARACYFYSMPNNVRDEILKLAGS